MAYTINAENLLLNYFTSHPEEHKLGIRYIKELSLKVEGELPVFVGYYKDDLVEAIVRTNAFKWNENELDRGKYGDSIERIITHKDLKKIEPDNWNIPEDVREPYLKIVNNYEWDTLPHTAWHVVYKALFREQSEKDRDYLTSDETVHRLLRTPHGSNCKFEVGTTHHYIMQGLVDRKMAKKIGENYFMQDKIFWGL
ncbi:hypothetical protein KY334_01320 [Candidatus Woesearchaeota archaeon]|nr:hypothetical protein [Candidatus Woesearchaeota archaeon]